MTKMEKKFVNSKKHGLRNIDLFERLVKKFDINSIENVLEIGCGVGILAAHLNKKYDMDVLGIDIDPEQIKLAKEHQEEKENLQFMVADATKLKFSENQKYDLAVSTFVLHHIPMWTEALSEINRVLKQKGYYIFHDLTYSKNLVKIFKPLSRKFGLYSAKDITEFLEENNFKIIYEEKARQFIFKIYCIVFQKNETI